MALAFPAVMKAIRTIRSIMIVAALAGLAACGGRQEVAQDGVGNTTTPTPAPTATPAPVAKAYTIRFSNLHVYDPGDTFGSGDCFYTFALNDTVRYSGQISVSANSDYNPENFGVTSIDFAVLDGDPIYIYADGYDVDPANNHTAMGTVNTGWYAGSEMIGTHTVAAENPYHYDLTYEILAKNVQ